MIFPGSLWDCWWVAPLAFILDMFLGDPELPWPHPVCLIGKFLDWQENFWRFVLSGCKFLELIAGFLSVFLTAGISFAFVCLLCNLPWAGCVFSLYFAWAGLAFGCLVAHGKQIISAIENKPLENVQAQVSMLVSRDVTQMDRKTLKKTLADTLSENFTDAFTAPFFWLLLTGPAGLWAYKSVSTMDSQWGYKTPLWKNLGFACARCDDLLAWLPARISALCLFLTDFLVRRFHLPRFWSGNWPGFAAIRKDASGMPSPNSGWSMAACAWLCGGKMAGPSIYFGEIVHKEWLGPSDRPEWDSDKLCSLLGLLKVGAIVTAVCLWNATSLAVLMMKTMLG